MVLRSVKEIAFLDVNFNLSNGVEKSLRKFNKTSIYIDLKSNIYKMLGNILIRLSLVDYLLIPAIK